MVALGHFEVSDHVGEDFDAPVIWGELYRVAEKVVEDLLEFFWVGSYGQKLWREVLPDRDILFRCESSRETGYFRQGAGHGESFKLEVHLAGFHLGEVEDFVDKLQQVSSADGDVLGIFELFFVERAK